MLRIRLSRTGKKRQPSYRVVVAEKEAKRDGRVVERIGHYNPLTNPATFLIDEARALYWLSVGAQPSDAVRVLLNKQGTFDRLARVHGGESLDAVVAEYRGTTVDATAPEAVAVAAAPVAAVAEPVAAVAEPVAEAVTAEAEESPSLLQRAAGAVSSVAETVVSAAGAGVAAVAEPVADVLSAARDSVEAAVQAVIGSDEEE